MGRVWGGVGRYVAWVREVWVGCGEVWVGYG